MVGPYFEGSYRRRIRLTSTAPGTVEAGLEDDFHHFEVTLRHDGARVVDVDARAVRWPWSTCPAAAGPLRALIGMPLSPRCLAVGEHTDPHANYTHMFDLAGLAVAHAARGLPTHAVSRRQYDAAVPFGAVDGAPTQVELRRNGEPVLVWTLQGRGIVDPPAFAGAPWHGGFFRWADRKLSIEDAEAAIVLRRSCEIGMGRGMDLDAIERADELGDFMNGVCYTMQPVVMNAAVRNKGTIRDFSETPDELLG